MFFWKIIYIVYPPILRVLEKIKIHNQRQPYLIGCLCDDKNYSNLKDYLKEQGFEDAILAWRDPCEILGMRKTKGKFQYHIRLFEDREMRCHYEYSSEGNPWKEKLFFFLKKNSLMIY